MKILKNLELKKLIAVNLVMIFMFAMFQDFSYAVSVTPFNSSIINNMMMGYGKTVETYSCSSNVSRGKIYVIENLHCNRVVQENINEIIEDIKDKEGDKLKTIAVEGSWGQIDTASLKNIKNEKVKNSLINFFLDNGYLNGAELYSVKHPKEKVEVYGIEEPKLYAENFKTLYGVMLEKEKTNDRRGRDVRV